MNRTYIIGGVVLVAVIGVAALTLPMFGAQSEQADFFSQVQVQQCESTKQSVCATDGTINASDYPDSCTQNGEHALDQPYTC